MCIYLSRGVNDISSSNYWRWVGFGTCAHHQDMQRLNGESCTYLDDIIPSEKSRLSMLDEIIKRYKQYGLVQLTYFELCDCRFLIVIPSTVAQSVSLSCYHPDPSDYQHTVDFKSRVKSELAMCVSHYHPVNIRSSFYFPERRLIQYDCGM